MKQWLLVVTLLMACLFGFSQEPEPDYTKIKFKKKLQDYKKEKPSLKELDIDKEMISDIVRLLGKSHYSIEERDEITEKIWLAFIDPKKFDLVFKDYAIRSLPNWTKKNFRGDIVLEPNPNLYNWTEADDEITYFKTTLHRILTYERLFGYGEDAKNTKKSLSKMLYAKKLRFRPLYKSDWTNSYLQSLKPQLKAKGLVLLITNNGTYEFMICQADKKEELLKLFKRMNWSFTNP